MWWPLSNSTRNDSSLHTFCIVNHILHYFIWPLSTLRIHAKKRWNPCITSRWGNHKNCRSSAQHVALESNMPKILLFSQTTVSAGMSSEAIVFCCWCERRRVCDKSKHSQTRGLSRASHPLEDTRHSAVNCHYIINIIWHKTTGSRQCSYIQHHVAHYLLWNKTWLDIINVTLAHGYEIRAGCLLFGMLCESRIGII